MAKLYLPMFFIFTIMNILLIKSHASSAAGPLVPMRAPPELVLAVAAESAKLEALKPLHHSHEISKQALRSGDYWNGVWKEQVSPEQLLRTSKINDNWNGGVWKEKVVSPQQILRTSKINKSQKTRDPIPNAENEYDMKIAPGTQLYKLITALRKISPKMIYVINK